MIFLISAEDCEAQFTARGYRTVAALARANLTEGGLQELGVRGYGVRGMVSALRKKRQAEDLLGVAAPEPALEPAPEPAPAPAPAGAAPGLQDLLEWS